MSRPNIVYTSYSRLLGRYGFLKESHMLVLVSVLSNVSTPCVEISDFEASISTLSSVAPSYPSPLDHAFQYLDQDKGETCKAFLSTLKSHIHPSYAKC